MSKYISLILLLLVFISGNGYAATPACDATSKGIDGPTVLFVNGILNKAAEGCTGLRKLKAQLASSGAATSKLNFSYFYNSTEEAVADINELRIQAALSSAAIGADLSKTSAGYYQQLGTIYKSLIANGFGSQCRGYINYDKLSPYYLRGISTAAIAFDSDWDQICYRIWGITGDLSKMMSTLAKGKGVVVVAHSQGNFYLEAAYSLLLKANDPNISKIKGVGIAAISRYPLDNRYLTISQDNAIYDLQYLNTSILKETRYHPAAPTNTACLIGLSCVAPSDGVNPNVLYLATGTAALPVTLGNLFFPDDPSKHYLMHELVEVYLSPQLVDSKSGIPLREQISNMVVSAAGELVPGFANGSVFQDDFLGSSLDLSKWTSRTSIPGFGEVSVSDGSVHIGNCQFIDTKDKAIFSGGKIVIELKFSGVKYWGYDSHVYLTDLDSGATLNIGDTIYNQFGVYYALYSNGAYEAFGTFGGTTLSPKVYRITIESTKLTIQRGDSIDALAELHVVALPRDITSNRRYYLNLGTGGCDGYYSPADFDWVRVESIN